MSKYERWGRVDGGSEGTWKPDRWRGVLAIIKKHEGTDYRDSSNPVYPELQEAFPQHTWFDKENNRSFFRDFRTPWTAPGLLSLEDNTFRITDLGNQFLSRDVSGAEVLVLFFQSYVDSNTGDKPFSVLCRAMLEANKPLSLAELDYVGENYRPGDDIGEVLKDLHASETREVSRGFRHFVTLLNYAGVIGEEGVEYSVWNRPLAEKVAGVIASEPKTVCKALNLIFFGPPGTGKSFQAEKAAKSCVRHHRVLFHPEYTHAQFVGMLRPVVGYHRSDEKEIVLHDGNPTDRQPFTYFSFVPGVFSRALADAYNVFSDGRSVALIIDEINRGDCAAIFGDIFQLLDRDEAGFSQYGISVSEEMRSYLDEAAHRQWDVKRDGLLYLPPNLEILATMNTSDQSLYPMDSAFKRRWEWSYVPIEFLDVHAGVTLTDSSGSWDWPRLVASINQSIVAGRQEDKQIGPWFVRAGGDGVIPESVFANKVLFYLWHDVWSEEIGTADCPFDLPSGAESFGELQKIFRQKGLKGVFKEKLWGPLQEPSGHEAANSTDPGD